MFGIFSAGSEDAPETALDGMQVAIFNTFSFISFFSLVLVAASAFFSSTAHRSKTWYAHLLGWMVYVFGFLLLVGRQTGPPPPTGLCIVQMAFVHSTPVLATFSALCLMTDIYLRLSASLWGDGRVNPRWETVFMLLPGTLTIITFLLAISFVNTNASNVTRFHFYCHMTTATPSLIAACAVVIAGLYLFPLEIYTAVILYKHWVAFRALKNDRSQPQGSLLSLSLFIRVFLFTLMAMTGVGLSSASIGKVASPYWSLVLPTVPMIAAITFGSQVDLLSTWIFWKPIPRVQVDMRERQNGRSTVV